MIKSIYERVKDSISNFTFDIINNLGFLIPVLIGLVSFVSGVVNYIKFIVTGGYSSQVSATKEFGIFDGYDQKFTTGTTGLITAGVVGKILLVLVLIEFVLLMINYFRTSGKVKRIVMIVDLVILAIQTVPTIIIFGIVFGNLIISKEAIYEVLKPFDGMTINPKAILITYAVLTIASLICFLVLVLITRDCRWMIRYSAIALAISYIAIPLVFLFLQNVIPLVTGAVALAVIGLFIFIVFKAPAGGGGKTGSDSDSSSSSASSVNGGFSKPVIRWDIPEDAIIMVEEGFGGKIIKPYGKYLLGNKYEKEITTPLHVELIGHASFEDLKNGSLIITVKGKRITEKDVIFKR